MKCAEQFYFWCWMQVHQGWWQIACWLSLVCLEVVLLNVRGNQLLWCMLQIFTQKLKLYMASSNTHLFTLLFAFFIKKFCQWFVIIAYYYFSSLTVISNNSILWLHNIHHRLLVLWCSISIVCQWRCVKEKLLGIPFHHVPEIVVLHRHHLMHLYKLCIISLDLGRVILVLGWLIPWMLGKHCSGLVSIWILLADELIVWRSWLF